MYKPVQPAVGQWGGEVSYHEFLPDPRLQHVIYCYWQLKTNRPLTQQFNYRVVADGCIDIIFEMNNPADSFVMGFCKKYTEFELENSFNYFGIRFLPAGFPHVFKLDASELSNRVVNLADVVPPVAAFIRSRLDADKNPEEVIASLNSYFLSSIAQLHHHIDNRFYEAFGIILNKAGVVDVQKDLDTGISERQLRRLFEFYIGDSAKTFCKVVRFQHVLNAKPSTQSLRKNKLFYDAGYYDQAHFIKDFKNFYGVTPGEAFGR
jgi:AraC-like DNA-binding protein